MLKASICNSLIVVSSSDRRARSNPNISVWVYVFGLEPVANVKVEDDRDGPDVVGVEMEGCDLL